jgi:hypothetical protein
VLQACGIQELSVQSAGLQHEDETLGKLTLVRHPQVFQERRETSRPGSQGDVLQHGSTIDALHVLFAWFYFL